MMAQKVTTFEMRYFTNDPKANGITDFHGETEWFTTGQRVDVLNQFANFASRFWGDPELNKPLFSDEEVSEVTGRVKPQPVTSVRTTIPLRQWRAYGYSTVKALEYVDIEGCSHR